MESETRSSSHRRGMPIVEETPGEPAVGQLCPACGLCCNGVLFADVKLQPADNLAILSVRGLLPQPKRRKPTIPQPCACFDGKLCSVYKDRPTRCRSFECGTLKRVQSGELAAPEALQLIRKTRTQVEVVRKLMRRLGDKDEHLPLSRRFAQIMAQPLDLSGDEDLIEDRARLMLAVDTLMDVSHTHFLT